MTLTKAVKAAKGLTAHKPPSRWPFGAHKNWDELKLSLESLPDKPRSENEIKKLIGKNISQGRTDWINDHNGSPKDLWEYMAENIIRALKDAGCLYVEEE